MPALNRRTFLAGAAGVAAMPTPARGTTGAGEMHGLIGKLRAVSGTRDALIAILLEGAGEMPGCRSYVVAKDPTDPDAIWITEVWDNRESHAASLRLPRIRDAIARARPMIAGFDSHVETVPMGGIGLV